MSTSFSKVKVLVVEDSPVAQLLLIQILQSDSGIEVIGSAENGKQALKFLKHKKPDVILMDIQMPGLNGLEVTRTIMEQDPVPIIICSAGLDPADSASTFRALEEGAVAVVPKPVGPSNNQFHSDSSKLIETVKLMSEVKMVRRWPRPPGTRKMFRDPNLELPLVRSEPQVVAIGASTGGPVVLQTILASLPKEFAMPILVVQHMSTGFLGGLAEWLHTSTGFPIHIAAHRQNLLPGHVYLAPDSYHMGLSRASEIALSKTVPENGLRPSVSYLFRSVANVCGRHAVGILLTGMGTDGAEGLKLLKDCGAVTIAQDQDSSVVHGMPGQAIKMGAACLVLGPVKISHFLSGLAPKNAEKI